MGTSVSLTDMCLYLPVTLPATIMTSSVPTTVGGHMMYPSPHAVMYAPTSGLADGSLTVLNAFSQAPSTMQVSHSQVQEQGELGGWAEKRRTIVSLIHTHTHTHTRFLPTPNICPMMSTQTRMLIHASTHMHTDTCIHTLAPMPDYLDTQAHLNTHTHTHTWTLTLAFVHLSAPITGSFS